MASDGALVGYSVFVELRSQVLNLMDARVEHVILGVLVEPHGRVQVAPVHTAVGDISLEGDAEELSTLVPVLAVGGNEAAHVHHAVFLGRHRHRIHVAVHLAGYLLDALVAVAFLARLDEIGILGKASRVHDDGNTVAVA